MEDRKRLVQREESVRLSPHVYLMSILNLTGVCGTATHRRAAGVCVCLCYTQCVLTAGLLGRVISLLSSLASWPSVLEAELPKTQTQEDVFHKTVELAQIGEDRTLRKNSKKQFKGTFCNYPLQISPLGGSISSVGLVSLPKSKLSTERKKINCYDFTSKTSVHREI